MVKTPEHVDTSSIHGRMSGSPRRVVQELEVLVTMTHVVKLQVTSPMTEDMARKEACHKIRVGIVSMDPSIELKSKVIGKKEV